MDIAHDNKELWERLARIEEQIALEQRLWEERALRLDERWSAQEKSRTAATKELEQRLYLLNELRGTVLERSEYEVEHRALESRVQALSEDQRLYLTRNDYDARHRDLERRLSQSETSLAAVPAREEYDDRHQTLDRRLAALEAQQMPRHDIAGYFEAFNKRTIELENWRANLTGRMVVFGVLGLLIVGVVASLIGWAITTLLG